MVGDSYKVLEEALYMVEDLMTLTVVEAWKMLWFTRISCRENKDEECKLLHLEIKESDKVPTRN